MSSARHQTASHSRFHLQKKIVQFDIRNLYIFSIFFCTTVFDVTKKKMVPNNNNYYGFFVFAERKRRVYDQYGKDGLLGQNERHHHRSSRRTHDYDDLDFGFVFRSPDEVFREFFGVKSPFADIFFGMFLWRWKIVV